MANEKRLIDANPIVQFIMDGLNNPDKLKALGHDAIEILAEIEFADTVEAVEVVHGRWVKKTADYVYYYACSECGEPVLKSQWGNDFFSAYCHNCGAKMMDGDGNV